MTNADLRTQSPGIEQIMLRPYHRVVRGDADDGYFAEVQEWRPLLDSGGDPGEGT